MASMEGIGSPFIKQLSARSPKLRIYESLFLLNQGVDHLVALLRNMGKFPFADKDSMQYAVTEIEEVRCDVNADFTEKLADSERFDEATSGSNVARLTRGGKTPMTFTSTSNAESRNARKRGYPHVLSEVFSRTPQLPQRKNVGKQSRSGRRSAPGSLGSNGGQS